MRDHLELPRPARLLRTISVSLIESTGLPAAALILAGLAGGRNAGVVAALAATWVTVAVRKATTGSVPGLLTISALVLSVQTAIVISTGQLWLYLLQFPAANLAMAVLFAGTARSASPLVARLAGEMLALRLPTAHHPGLERFFQGATWLWAAVFFLLTIGLGVLMVTEPLGMFVVASTVITAGLILAGIGVSVWWFRLVLRKSDLGLRFAAV